MYRASVEKRFSKIDQENVVNKYKEQRSGTAA